MGAYLPGKRVVAVGGGKGGVGKSLVTANLATSFARLGLRTIVFDADLNAPNLHTLFGIERPERTLEDFLDGTFASLGEVMLDGGVAGLQLICGSPQATLGGIARDAEARRRLIKALARLDTDCLLIDVGAGLDHTSLDFFNAGDLRLLVLTPEITSLQNGYSFLKMAMYRRLQRFVAHHPAGERLSTSLGGRAFEIGSSMSKLSTFLEVVDGEAPELSRPIRLLAAEYAVGLVGNMLLKQDDRNVMHAVARMNQQFLNLETEVLACFRTNPKIRASINQGKPFALGASSDYDVAEYARLARRLLGLDLDKLRKLRAQIVDALAKTSVPVAFGFEGMDVPVEEDAPSGVHMPAPAAAPAAAADDPEADEFIEEISRASRSGIRVDGPTYVELNVGGHWHLGSLVELSSTRACLTGIHTGGKLQEEPTAMRLVNLRGAHHDDDDDDEASQVPVKLHRYDAASGRLTLELCDPTSARLLMTLCRGAVPPSASV
jgi:flagellar biosynthesis protein FlhG